MRKICIFDNYDSFTYNLYHLFCRIKKAEYYIVRNRDRSVFDLDFDVLIISPGPMGPGQTGCLKELFLTRIIPDKIPVFGVCLGMQFLAAFFGSGIVQSHSPVHGRTVTVIHRGEGILRGIQKTFSVMRYNSLEVKNINDKELNILAWEEKTEIIMAIAHRHLPFTGVQFHPESFLTQHSNKLISNFFKLYVED